MLILCFAHALLFQKNIDGYMYVHGLTWIFHISASVRFSLSIFWYHTFLFSWNWVEFCRLMCISVVCSPCSPDSNYEAMTSKWPSVWVKISSSWICIALYVWTLVAPLVLVNRDFDWNAHCPSAHTPINALLHPCSISSVSKTLDG